MNLLSYANNDSDDEDNCGGVRYNDSDDEADCSSVKCNGDGVDKKTPSPKSVETLSWAQCYLQCVVLT
jgi:hypothetical protein